MWSDAEGLLDLLPSGRPDKAAVFKGSQLSFGGWLNAGVMYNALEPGDRYNGPVTFTDRSSELQLNQLYFHIQRDLNVGGGSWDWGARVDIMFGTDAQFTAAAGDADSHWDLALLEDRFYQFAFPQAYAELLVPVGNGLRIKLGHFYTIVGGEAITAPDNFFYSRSYVTQFGEPFTHTGLLLTYPITDHFSLTAGAVTGSATGGWDGAFDRSHNNVGFLGGFAWTSEGGDTSVAINATHGEIREAFPRDINLISSVLQYDLAASLHWKIQHDYGWTTAVPGIESAQWYGFVNYLNLDVSDTVASGIRFEWFRDDDGVRVLAPVREQQPVGAAAGYFAMTAGLNWKPMPWLTLRSSLRYDWSNDVRAFAERTASDQILLSFDVLMMF